MSNLKGARTCLETLDLKPNFSELGRLHGMDRRTAKKKYYGIENKQKRVKTSILDKHFEVIKTKLGIPGTPMIAVYKYIKMNIDSNIGSYSNFRKYVNKNDELIRIKDTKAHVLFETDYGKQLQFDWKGPIILHTKDKTAIKFYIFSTTLCASRFHTFIYSNFMVREDVQRCLIETFEMLGGTPEECLTDNMSSIINYSQHDFTTEFKTFCKDMGFVPKHCQVNHPETKGKDESCNRFMAWLNPYDYEFSDETELIEIVKKLNKEINREVSQTTGLPPVELFQKEKEYLNPLPSQNIIDGYLDSLIPVKVQNTMLFYYKGHQYSVPQKYINHTLKVKESDNKLLVYYNRNLIVTHKISEKKVNYREEDYIEGLTSTMPYKSDEDIEALAKHNLELFEKNTK